MPTVPWTNSIGAPELITVWHDPDFDPSLPAEVSMTTQERAYTSPIWYRPKS